MSQNPLRGEQMNPAGVIDQAQTMTRELVHRESRGPGDIPNAMRRLGTRYGIPYAVFVSLRYRPPKRIWADVFLKISAAYEAERLRQLKLLRHEIAITREIAGASANSVRTAEALVDTTDEKLNTHG